MLFLKYLFLFLKNLNKNLLKEENSLPPLSLPIMTSALCCKLCSITSVHWTWLCSYLWSYLSHIDLSLIKKRLDGYSRQCYFFQKYAVGKLCKHIVVCFTIGGLKIWAKCESLCESVESLKQPSHEIPANCFCLSWCFYSAVPLCYLNTKMVLSQLF